MTRRCGAALKNSMPISKPPGVEVLLDDRDERPGVKFKDCDLLGLPFRVVVGAKALAQGNAEVRHRRASDNLMVPLKDLISYLKDQIAQELHG